jgi:hypothetical protein
LRGYLDRSKAIVNAVELEGPDLSSRISERKEIDAVLDLVGNSTILDSLARRGDRACLAMIAGAPVGMRGSGDWIGKILSRYDAVEAVPCSPKKIP